MSKKIFLCVFISIFFLLTAFSESWYVCLGSYKNLNNAENLVEQLKVENIFASICLHETEDIKLYRVLLDESFSILDEARKKRDEIQELDGIKKLNISGLWACMALSENFIEKNIVLTSNVTEDISVSDEKPFSVLVRSYKEEQSAINDKERLSENDIDAYILKMFDDSSYFSFDLHAGAFNTEEETIELQDKLSELGIEDTQISHYEDIVENLEKYDEMIETHDVTFDTGKYSIPSSFSPWITKCINQFPINKNFQIENIYLFDMDNIIATDTTVDELLFASDYLTDEENVHAISFATYRDDLYDNEVEIFIAVADDGTFANRKSENDNKTQFAIVDDVIDCTIISDSETDYYLYGTNPLNNMLVIMEAKNFTENQFDSFIKNISNDSSLLVYPQLRKNLLVLPEKNNSIQRDFLYFTLSRVEENYAEEKNYAPWAIPIVGHWNAESIFYQNNTKFSVSFFDMDYDYNASRIHDMFMSEKTNISEENHPSTLENVNSWYINLIDNNELSFSTKSYIIAINSYIEKMTEENLIDIAKELKIWK